VCDLPGVAYPDLIMLSASQEHGILEVRAGTSAALPGFAIGDRLRILPNRACATAAQHDCYKVVCGA